MNTDSIVAGSPVGEIKRQVMAWRTAGRDRERAGKFPGPLECVFSPSAWQVSHSREKCLTPAPWRSY